MEYIPTNMFCAISLLSGMAHRKTPDGMVTLFFRFRRTTLEPRFLYMSLMLAIYISVSLGKYQSPMRIVPLQQSSLFVKHIKDNSPSPISSTITTVLFARKVPLWNNVTPSKWCICQWQSTLCESNCLLSMVFVLRMMFALGPAPTSFAAAT